MAGHALLPVYFYRQQHAWPVKEIDASAAAYLPSGEVRVMPELLSLARHP